MQAQLEREDPNLRRDVVEREGVAKRKELETDIRQQEKITAKSKTSSAKASRSPMVNEVSAKFSASDRDGKLLPIEDETLTRMRRATWASSTCP